MKKVKTLQGSSLSSKGPSSGQSKESITSEEKLNSASRLAESNTNLRPVRTAESNNTESINPVPAGTPKKNSTVSKPELSSPLTGSKSEIEPELHREQSAELADSEAKEEAVNLQSKSPADSIPSGVSDSSTAQDVGRDETYDPPKKNAKAGDKKKLPKGENLHYSSGVIAQATCVPTSDKWLKLKSSDFQDLVCRSDTVMVPQRTPWPQMSRECLKNQPMSSYYVFDPPWDLTLLCLRRMLFN